jgi:hypothetical protein
VASCKKFVKGAGRKDIWKETRASRKWEMQLVSASRIGGGCVTHQGFFGGPPPADATVTLALVVPISPVRSSRTPSRR